MSFGASPQELGLFILGLAALAHLALRWWIGRRAQRAENAEPSEPRRGRWVSRVLREIASPLALLIWIQGLYWVLVLVAGQAPARRLSALDLGYGVANVAAIFWLLVRTGRVMEAFLLSLPNRDDTEWDDVAAQIAAKAARRLLPWLALILAAPALAASPGLAMIVRNGSSLVLIAVVAFILFQAVGIAAEFLLRQHRIDVVDNLQARAIHTQVLVLKKVATVVIAVFTVASMLMVFDSVRQFGASILASAGIAGIIIGFAAQRSIATLLAGFQIALTQPIRVDDVVIVENEWGRIEDITLTYVVVRIWDLRRLVVPITYFIEQPFQNWTRASADILATVFLHVDYRAPLGALRAELTRVLSESRHWDGKVNVLQVTEAREHTLEIRALASGADASKAWDLRCEVREKLVEFLQRHHPESLPRVRASLDAGAGDALPLKA